MSAATACVGVFIPHLGCPHTCSFCNQVAITDTLRLPEEREIAALLERAPPARPKETELAFFGGSFTAIPRAQLLRYLELGAALVAQYGLRGIRLSTRPDAVGEDICALLRRYPVTTVELGAQSMDDAVLAASGRGHTAQQVVEASGRIRAQGLSLVLQMMTGLPGDCDEGALRTAEQLIALRPQGVRIYPTLVLRQSELERLHRQGLYRPQELEQAVALCCRLSDLFDAAGIPIVKMGLHAAESFDAGELVAGPYHPAFRELVEGRRYLERALPLLEGLDARGKRLVLTVARGHTSRMAGHGGANRAALLARSGAARLAIRECDKRSPFTVEITVEQLTPRR